MSNPTETLAVDWERFISDGTFDQFVGYRAYAGGQHVGGVYPSALAPGWVGAVHGGVPSKRCATLDDAKAFVEAEVLL